MAAYSYIGYAPNVISVSFFNGTVTLATTYDPNTDRRVFNVQDDPGPPNLVNGDPDNGTDFNGDRFNNENGDDLTQQGLVTDLDGTPIGGLTANGDIYLEESYTLTNPNGGTIDVYRVEVNGTLAGYITSEPLDPGVAYAFTVSNVTPDNAPDTTDPDAIVDVPCFVLGTMIQTPEGDVTVENLKCGDLVTTAEGNAKKIRWIGSRTIDVSQSGQSHLKPIRISKNALGLGSPTADLLVSPNHKVLISEAELEVLFDESEVLIPAKLLLEMPGVEVVNDASQVTYYHFIFDQHEIVFSNGAKTESLYPGDMALRGVTKATQDELFEIFPGVFDDRLTDYGPTAAAVLKKHEVSVLVANNRTKRPERIQA